MIDDYIIEPIPHSNDGWRVVRKSTGATERYGIGWTEARVWVEKHSIPKPPTTAEPEKKGVTTDVADSLRRAGKILAEHTDPAPMPGYGQIYVNENKVWYVGGDGDEKGFDKVVEDVLRNAYPGMKELIYEAEAFPKEEDGWIKVYPKAVKKGIRTDSFGRYWVIDWGSDGELVRMGPYKSWEEAWAAEKLSAVERQRKRLTPDAHHADRPGVPDGVFTVAVDLHGTLADHAKGDPPAPIGPPLPGAREAMQEFRRLGFRTVINSVFDDVDLIREWLDGNDIPCDYVNESPWGNDGPTSGKIDADVYVDDRGLHFKGDWAETTDHVKLRAKKELKSIWQKHLDPHGVKRKSIADRLGDAMRAGNLRVVDELAKEAIKAGVTDYEKLVRWLGPSDGSPEVYDGVQQLQHVLEAEGTYGYGRYDVPKAYGDIHAAGPGEAIWNGESDEEFGGTR